ncbi:uncharacterized protein V1510DRAFT_435862 [Dipodascopsis tothii]|uniref:uncharacterized protein n=1 Tax=Dipodascopsis tothii TaxID=44089 RepID=UPI0034CE62CA
MDPGPGPVLLDMASRNDPGGPAGGGRALEFRAAFAPPGAPEDAGPAPPGKPRRAYKACIHCRIRKAKCMFSEPVFKPPCLRCQREGKECRFLPSRRGGRTNIDKDREAEAWPARRPAPDPAAPGGPAAPDDASKRRRKLDDESGVDTEALAFSFLRNPSEALDILARASTFHADAESASSDESDVASEFDGSVATPAAAMRPAADRIRVQHLTNPLAPPAPAPAGQMPPPARPERARPLRHQERISEFAPVRLGYLNPTQLRTLVMIFFSRHHNYLPLIQSSRMPLNDELLSEFAAAEPFLLTAIVVVASRYENDSIHDSCWLHMQQQIADLMFGTEPTVGAVESLLLLSENIPRLAAVETHKLSSHEERVAWNLIGMAVRLSYYLGLDQKTLLTTAEPMDLETHRQRLAWTYCYMHDRQASIRLGKAFWSRGPGLCFQNPNVGASVVHDSAVNFPSLARSAANREDLSSHVQAQIELTQMLTNIHDTLYPSRDRTIALVPVGEYYRILDEYTRAFSAFQLAWQAHSWESFPLNETVWLTFHYAKLYAYGFAFQSHLRRMTKTYKDTLTVPAHERPSLANVVFPRGLIGSPDAKFIIEAKVAATEILRLCIDKLHPGGALAYMPARYYGYISYAVVFLIKIVFTGAVIARDQQTILALVKRIIGALMDLAGAVDRQHPLVRRTGQLKVLVRTLWTVEGMPPPPTRPGSPVPAEAALPVPEPPVDEISSLGDMFAFDAHTAASEGSDGGADLTSLLSFDIDSDLWMSYFDPPLPAVDTFS